MVAHDCNPSTWEAEAGGFLSSRPAWSTEWVQDSQSYTEKPCLKTNKQTNKQTNKKTTKQKTPQKTKNKNNNNNKKDFQLKVIRSDEEVHLIFIKVKIHHDKVSILNIYSPNTKAPTLIKENFLNLKTHIETHTIIVRDFNTPLWYIFWIYILDIYIHVWIYPKHAFWHVVTLQNIIDFINVIKNVDNKVRSKWILKRFQS